MSETTIRTGTSAIIKSGNNTFQSNINQDNQSFDARVSYVLLDDHDKERFNKYGGYDSIGLIECFKIIDGNLDTIPIVALPLNSNNRRFPVENEIVKVVSSTNNSSQNLLNSRKASFYYDDIIGLWGSIEHNSIPDQDFLKNTVTDKSKVNNYTDSNNGIIKKTEELSDVSITGERFKETGNVRKLKHQPGDITYEGRFGNSIRIGGSNSKFKSPWKGPDNSPMVIISNNHGNIDKNNLDPIFEDINKDGSSIYLLSGQTVEFIPANTNFESYNQKVSIKSNIVQPKIIVEETVNTPAEADVKKTSEVTKGEDTPVVYNTQVSSSNESTIDDDIQFLPDREDVQQGEIIFSEFYVIVIDPEYEKNIAEMRKNVILSDNSYPVDLSQIKPISANQIIKTYITPKINEIAGIPRGIQYLMEAQIFFEGFYPPMNGKRASNSFRNNNPGNFVWDEKYAKYGGKKSVDKVGEGFGVTFPDLKSGLTAKKAYIDFIRSGKSESYKLGPNSPIWNGKEYSGYIDTYCPKSDRGAKNDPLAYATHILGYFKGKGLMINYSTTINQLYTL